MKKETLGFKVAAWVLTVTGVVPKDEVRRRLRKAINEELRLIIKAGTVVEIKCPMCRKDFQYEVPSDNAPVKLYCGSSCKKRAIEWRKDPHGVLYCKSPDKNKYPNLEVARSVQQLMNDEDAWRLNAYPCPEGHWHIGRVQGRIVSTPTEKE